MSLITWSAKLELGVPEMDAEHKKFVKLTNELHDALSQGQAGDVIEPILEGLKAYGNTHFQHEEALMAKHRFPGLAAHKALHAAFLKEVAQLGARSGAGKLGVSLAAMKMVRGWLVEHIEKVDTEYAAFLLEHHA